MRVRLLASALLATLAVLLLVPVAYGQPAPPSRVAVLAVEEFSVNITFEPSPSPEVAEYRIYVSGVNGSSLSQLRPAPGFSYLLYDQVRVTPHEAIGALQKATADPRFWFRNVTQEDWTLGYEEGFTKHVPGDFDAVAYRVTGLQANISVYVAVTAVDSEGVENPTVTPVEAVPLAPAVPEKPSNEGIIVSWILILAAVLGAVFYVSRREARKNRKAYLYILPPLLGLVALTFYPVIFGFFLSFTDRQGTQEFAFNFIGLANYFNVFLQPDLIMVTTTTFVWTIVTVAFHVTIGLFLAILLNRRIRGRTAYRALLLLPWAIPSYITTLTWRGMFETHQGLVNALLGPGGWALLGCDGPCQWLTATGTPLPLMAVMITNIWLGFSFMMMVFSGGLQGIPPELYEAADVDGLTRWQKLRHITLPLLKPTLVPASLLGFIWTFNMFNVIYLMTQGGPPVPGMRAGGTDILITYVYSVGFQPPFEHGFAAAYSVVIFIMLLSFGLFYTRYTGAFEAFAGGTVPVERRARKPRFGFGLISRLREAWRRRVSEPIRAAMSPDQPEYLRARTPLILGLAALGIFEVVYGALTYSSMEFWFIVTAVHGAWFFVVGLGLLLGSVGLGFRQRAGRRLATWALLLQVLGALLAFLSGPLPLLLAGEVTMATVFAVMPRTLALVVGVGLLAWVTRFMPEYTTEPDPWTRLVDALARLRTGPALDGGTPRVRRLSLGRWSNVGVHLVLLFFVLVVLLPVLLVAGTAFSEFPAMALVNVPILRNLLLPAQDLPGWTLEHFVFVIGDSQFFLWLRNSLLVAGGTVAVGVLLSVTGAYAFSRFNFRGKRWSMLSFIVVQMFPGVIILIPYYILLFQLGLINTHIGLVVMYSVTALPFILWFLKGFFDTIPYELEEAAMIDGTTRVGALWRIIVPLAKPAIAVAALFSFLAAWNEWLLAFTFMTSSANYTLPVGITSFVNPPQTFWNEFAAISILVALPVMVLFILFQRYLVTGLTSGAVKG